MPPGVSQRGVANPTPPSVTGETRAARRGMLSGMDVTQIYERCGAEFAARVHAVDGRWREPTPLPGWYVHDLVHHLVYEERWALSILAGVTIAEVGDRFEGELLGADPVATFDEAAAEAAAAVRGDEEFERTVHLSFGDFPAGEYVMQLAADHLVHAVDLARAIGADERLDPDVTEAVLKWFEPMEPMYRSAGVIGPRVDWPEGADAQARLLGMMGRTP